MSELTTTRIRAAAERLGLTHLPEQVTTLTARAEAEQLGYLDFLDLVLGEEVALREQRRFRNALKLSGLPHHKTLDEFDYTFQPGLEPRRIKDLATLQFRPAPTANSQTTGYIILGTDPAAGSPATSGRRPAQHLVLLLEQPLRRFRSRISAASAVVTSGRTPS